MFMMFEYAWLVGSLDQSGLGFGLFGASGGVAAVVVVVWFAVVD
jgi:hypothetical protein